MYEFTLDILDKKYSLYQWTDGRVNTVVTINGLLVGGMLVLASEDRFAIGKGFVEIARFIAPLCAFALSLGLALRHMAPKMDAGVGNAKSGNPRQVAGTEKYTPKEYLDLVVGLTIRDRLRLNCNQIKGMNTIIMRNNREIRRAIWLTIAGLVLMVYWILVEV